MFDHGFHNHVVSYSANVHQQKNADDLLVIDALLILSLYAQGIPQAVGCERDVAVYAPPWLQSGGPARGSP